MEYGLYARAAGFDYFETQLEGMLEFQFLDPLQRARAMLARRSYAELDYGLDSLDWLLRQGSRRFMREIMADQHGDVVAVNRPKALKSLVPVFEVSDQAGMPGATWSEYFALLALACVGEELYYEDCTWDDIYGAELAAQIDLDEAAARRRQQRWASVLEALEAVCYAEHLRDVGRLTRQLSEAERARVEAQQEWGRRGKQATMRPYDDLRQRLLAHYDAELSNRSNRGAAKVLVQRFQREIAEVLTTDDPVQQIAKWIGRHRRAGAEGHVSP